MSLTSQDLLSPEELRHKRLTQSLVVWGTIALLLIIDQAIKIWVKTHMMLGEDIRIFDGFHLLFVENEGMAYGITLGSKLFLTLFRIIAMGLLTWAVARLIGSGKYSTWFLIVLALITAGGVGNIIDSLFYGLMFSSSQGAIAEIFPKDGGYAPLFYGHVVDMFSCPLIDCTLPSWIPIWGGQRFTFFDPIFNFADACISVGVVALILFCRTPLSLALEMLSPKRRRHTTPPDNEE
ncbi:lipoprotein signal peptidase [Porphyromonas endodontalis]|uniref:lipoprotein signal peptidase n=1 Tax=Porphyromonas endodontalis TaxID=28124 RepID=UPI0028EC5775|nr:lipoprotein signal peptidase [Porphyromonas endodontalis]